MKANRSISKIPPAPFRKLAFTHTWDRGVKVQISGEIDISYASSEHTSR
jgi:hypothetical protein